MAAVLSSELLMPQATVPKGAGLPGWLMAAASAAIVCHFGAVLIPILDAPSGPWATPNGRSMEDPPAFAHALRGLADWHAQYLRLANNDHFAFNRPTGIPAVEMEVRLKDDAGKVTRTLHFPDPQANPWVRHRQELLARGLAPDLPTEPSGQEVVPAPGQKAPTADVWLTRDDVIPDPASSAKLDFLTDPDPDHPVQLRLRTVPLHLVPRGRGVMKPSDMSVVAARSYARCLCRQYGAAKAEIIRRTREPISPALLSKGEPPDDAFEELLASFGEVSP